MALETGTYISDLVAANPPNTDPLAQAAGHLQLIKSTVKATFPNLTGAVTPTQVELNRLAGVTSGVQSQIDAEIAARTAAVASKASLASPAFTGVPTAPTPLAGDNTNTIATTAFVNATSFVSALPGQAGNAGRFLTTNGSAASWAALTGITPNIMSGNATAAANGLYVMPAAYTLTLPASPAAGAVVYVAVLAGVVGAIVDPSAEKIRGTAGAMTVSSSPFSAQLIYTGAAQGWV